LFQVVGWECPFEIEEAGEQGVWASFWILSKLFSKCSILDGRMKPLDLPTGVTFSICVIVRLVLPPASLINQIVTLQSS
jgi:hypothetical protein